MSTIEALRLHLREGSEYFDALFAALEDFYATHQAHMNAFEVTSKKLQLKLTIERVLRSTFPPEKGQASDADILTLQKKLINALQAIVFLECKHSDAFCFATHWPNLEKTLQEAIRGLGDKKQQEAPEQPPPPMPVIPQEAPPWGNRSDTHKPLDEETPLIGNNSHIPKKPMHAKRLEKYLILGCTLLFAGFTITFIIMFITLTIPTGENQAYPLALGFQCMGVAITYLSLAIIPLLPGLRRRIRKELEDYSNETKIERHLLFFIIKDSSKDSHGHAIAVDFGILLLLVEELLAFRGSTFEQAITAGIVIISFKAVLLMLSRYDLDCLDSVSHRYPDGLFLIHTLYDLSLSALFCVSAVFLFKSICLDKDNLFIANVFSMVHLFSILWILPGIVLTYSHFRNISLYRYCEDPEIEQPFYE